MCRNIILTSVRLLDLLCELYVISLNALLHWERSIIVSAHIVHVLFSSKFHRRVSINDDFEKPWVLIYSLLTDHEPCFIKQVENSNWALSTVSKQSLILQNNLIQHKIRTLLQSSLSQYNVGSVLFIMCWAKDLSAVKEARDHWCVQYCKWPLRASL